MPRPTLPTAPQFSGQETELLSVFMALLRLLRKEHPDEIVLLIFLLRGYRPAIFYVEIDCLMISLKCLKPNSRMAASEKPALAVRKKPRAKTAAMQANINHHEVDQVFEIYGKGDDSIFFE